MIMYSVMAWVGLHTLGNSYGPFSSRHLAEETVVKLAGLGKYSRIEIHSKEEEEEEEEEEVQS